MSRSQAISSAVHYLQHAVEASMGQVMGLAGCWKLGHGCALTLLASQTGELRVAHGRVWITFADAYLDPAVRAGDYFLEAGESLTLPAGRALVMESFAVGDASAAYFVWEPAAHASGAAQLFSELRLALGMVAGAAGRLVRALAGGLVGGVRA